MCVAAPPQGRWALYLGPHCSEVSSSSEEARWLLKARPHVLQPLHRIIKMHSESSDYSLIQDQPKLKGQERAHAWTPQNVTGLRSDAEVGFKKRSLVRVHHCPAVLRRWDPYLDLAESLKFRAFSTTTPSYCVCDFGITERIIPILVLKHTSVDVAACWLLL